ncbi:MAG: hypothetical protein ACFCU1_08430 [Sumerlaeia bacterium]
MLVSSDGIPFGWIVLFGGRNYWEPDQLIEERGGVSSQRDQLISPMEVAQPRLQNAIDAFRQAPHLWPWLSSLEVLNNRLKTRSRKGFLKLNVPWMDESALKQLQKSTAYMENVVYQINAGNLDVSKLLTQFDEITPWSPHSLADDLTRFQNELKRLNLHQSCISLGKIIVGTPSQHVERFEEHLVETCLDPFESSFKFAPYPTFIEPVGSKVGDKSTHDTDQSNEKPSFFSRLFSRK